MKGCNRFTHFKDFGEYPFYFRGKEWVNLRYSRFYCGKHWPLFKAGRIKEAQYKPGSSINHQIPWTGELNTEKMETVKAKFRVTAVEHFETTKTAKMHAVYDPSGQYKDFTEATPWGELQMSISATTKAFDFFNPGDVVTLTFSKEESAEALAPADEVIAAE